MNVDEAQSVILFRRAGDRLSLHAREHTHIHTHARTQRQARARAWVHMHEKTQTPQVVTQTVIKLFFGVAPPPRSAELAPIPRLKEKRDGKQRSRREQLTHFAKQRLPGNVWADNPDKQK